MALDQINILADILRARAATQPTREACKFLSDGEREGGSISFAELDLKARALAAILQHKSGLGERAVMAYPSGLDFAIALWACFYAGVVAVPVAWRRNPKGFDNLRRVLRDSDARFLLVSRAVKDALPVAESNCDPDPLACARTIVTDEVAAEAAASWRRPQIDGSSLALLQYTSGSTLEPRGVMVSNANQIASVEVLKHAYGQDEQSLFVTWLPLFHDLGLMGMLLHAAYVGAPCVLMASQSFLQKPARWLRAMSSYRATITAAPNFAYELCSERISERDKRDLDLSNWRVAANAAEPVRRQTMERFVAAFGSYGFRAEAFRPSYGLAEAAVLVRCARFDPNTPALEVDGQKLGRSQLVIPGPHSTHRVSLVEVGTGPLEVAIVDPETGIRCGDNEVGEIWVSGGSVGQGYWGKPESAVETFQARLADAPTKTFLRTGDLGALREGILYVTGRRKGIIIVGGANHYPQDIEHTTIECHPQLRTLSAAAFAIERAGVEGLALACEVPRQFMPQQLAELIKTIRGAIALVHDIDAVAVILVRIGGVPKSSSGKVQRERCRQAWLEQKLPILAEWHSSESAPPAQPETVATAGAATADEIRAWLIRRISQVLSVAVSDLDTREPLARYGMNSVRAVSLSGDLADWLSRELPVTLFYDHPTIERLVTHLADETQVAVPRVRPRSAAVPIAVIGCACRFPGASTPEALWEILEQGKEAIAEIPGQRWDADVYYDPDPAVRGKMCSRRGGFLDRVDEFDHEFFGISLMEGRSLDPQQRILLQVVAEALEWSGQRIDLLAGTSTGVFIGICSSDYSRYHMHSGDPSRIDEFSLSGVSPSFAAGRIAYWLGVHGPTLAVDTACSSSLTAVHLACQSLGNGECDRAIAGGVNLILFPEATISLSQLRALSPDGHSKVFDADANGYVRSEGCGVVLLKRLEDAVNAGDRIIAVIAGSAVNQDGRSNGMMAPNGAAQDALLRSALARAGIEASQVAYVEAHGTGTSLGDPIELGALSSALCDGRAADQPLLVGSLKANIGHAEAAAGIAGLIKAMLVLAHRRVPPQINVRRPNPHIPWNQIRVRVPEQSAALPDDRAFQYVGVSSFGLSGTNAHVVLRPAPIAETVAAHADRPVHLLALSAKTESALAATRRQIADWTRAHPDRAVADVCFSVNTGRAAMDQRLAVVAGSREALLAGLELGNEAANHIVVGRRSHVAAPKLVLCLTGDASPPADFVHDLYQLFPVFRAAFDRFEVSDTRQDALPVMQAARSPLAFEYAVAELLRSWIPGVEEIRKSDANLGRNTEDKLLLHVGRDLKDWQSLLTAVARLYVTGLDVDWSAFDREFPRQRLLLPTYPFAPKRVWFASPQQSQLTADRGAFPGERCHSPLHDAVVFEAKLRGKNSIYDAHRIGGAIVVPASAYIAMAVSGAMQGFGGKSCTLHDLVFPHPLVLAESETRLLQVIFKGRNGNAASFEICSMDVNGQWITHAMGFAASDAPAARIDAAPMADIRVDERARAVAAADFYAALHRMGFTLHQQFRWNDAVWRSDDAALSVMRAPTTEEAKVQPLHPGLIDSLFQLVRAVFPIDEGFRELYVPLSVTSFYFLGGAIGEGAIARARLCGPNRPAAPPETFTADLELADTSGAVRVIARGLALKRAEKAALLGRKPMLQIEADDPSRQKKNGLQLDLARLRGADAGSRSKAVEDLVRQATAIVLGEDPASPIPLNRPFSELGMSSMMTLDLTQSLGSVVGQTLPTTVLFDHPTIESVARFIEQTLFPVEAPAAQASESANAQRGALAGIERLSERELESIVNQEFEKLEWSSGRDGSVRP